MTAVGAFRALLDAGISIEAGMRPRGDNEPCAQQTAQTRVSADHEN